MSWFKSSRHNVYVDSDKKGIKCENHNENLPEGKKGHLIVDKVALLALGRQIVWRYKNCANHCGTDTKLVDNRSPTTSLF